jgi:hypothetical protein
MRTMRLGHRQKYWTNAVCQLHGALQRLVQSLISHVDSLIQECSHLLIEHNARCKAYPRDFELNPNSSFCYVTATSTSDNLHLTALPAVDVAVGC